MGSLVNKDRPWTCVCGETGLDDSDLALAHQDKCHVWRQHRNECFCRGMGGKYAHEISPQTKGHVTVLFSCASCGFCEVPFEVPAQPRAVAMPFWMTHIFNPRLREAKADQKCTHRPDVLIPMGAEGRFSGDNRLRPTE
jgi:hypothetical protein